MQHARSKVATYNNVAIFSMLRNGARNNDYYCNLHVNSDKALRQWANYRP